MYNRGTKYLFKNNYAKALQFLKREPAEFKEKYLNMGNCYRGLGNLPRAVECYLRANDPNVPLSDGSRPAEYSLALNNLGLASYMLGDDATAISCYTRALSINPLYYEALWNYANAYLRSGFSGNEISWDKGWLMYDNRFKRLSGAVPLDSRIPLWDGVSSGESIVVIAEQGLGDKIMFSRYISCLREYFSEIIIECKPELDWFYSDYKIVRSAYLAAPVGVPVCSLVKYFFNRNVPHNWIGLGAINDDQIMRDNRIGVVWSGSATHANNHNRSCNPSYFSALSNLGTLYSLNPAAKPARNVIPMDTSSWEETVALIRTLDLVITVDTSIVHLAGTLDIPCIMIQPLMETDFRWGHGSSTYWYPSVTIVPNNDWDAAFAKVRTLATDKLLTARNARHTRIVEQVMKERNGQND